MARIKIRRKRKKSRKLYGTRYHGYGQVGEHKGSGQRGGKGKAGGKDHLKIKLLKEGHVFGSRGFTNKGPKPIYNPINIGRLVEMVKEGKIEYSVEGDTYIIDTSKLPYNKILGGGKVDLKLKIVLSPKTILSKRAAEKIRALGGTIEGGA